MILNLYIISRATGHSEANEESSLSPLSCQNNKELNVAVRKRKWECNYVSIISHYFKLKDMEVLFILLYMTQLRTFKIVNSEMKSGAKSS